MYGPPTYAPCYCHACSCERPVCEECGRLPCPDCREVECTCPPAAFEPTTPDPWAETPAADPWSNK